MENSTQTPRIASINIKGYRPFRDFTATLGNLEVCVGANGSGKSSLFEFLRFLRDGVNLPIPPEIVPGGVGQQVFHGGSANSIAWHLEACDDRYIVEYIGEIVGSVGNIKLPSETVSYSNIDDQGYTQTIAFDRIDKEDENLLFRSQDNEIKLLSIESVINEKSKVYGIVTVILRRLISDFKFYSAYSINKDKIRKSVVIEQAPFLREDCGNLSSVLHYLMTEHPAAFDKLQTLLRLIVPGFQQLTVKARGGPGEVISFWKEKNVDVELSLADLSDGILRLLCWMTLCVHPAPPPLICIDEPDQGVHPRTLPVLASLLQEASERTQVLVATHSSYFLAQFPLENIAVFRKEDGQAVFRKPQESAILRDMLADFGADEIEQLHRSDELEHLA